MSQKIIIKNSSGTTTPSLQYGELAIKYLNGSEALYTKNSSNQIIAFNDWAKILNKPTTLSGYGITDAVVKDGDVIMNTNPFGGRPLYINSIDNAMFAANKKWYVTVTTHLRTYNSETYPKLNPSWVESYTVTGSGTAFNVSGSPTSIVVYNSDTLCSEVTTPTTQNQYKYVGGVLTFGATVTGTIRVYPGYDVKQYIDSPVVNTLSGANAFDGSYETTIGVSTGYYMKINIKFNESGTAGFDGGYPYGRYFLSYYYTATPEKAEYRVYNRTYRPHIIGWKKYDFTDFKGTNANANYIQSFYDGGNYGRSEIEFIVYGHASHSTGLSQIDLKLDRPNLSVNGSTFTKYGNNKLYYNIYLGNQTSNNISLYQNGDINASGTITASSFVGNASSATKLQTSRTIWGQNFDGTGNVTGALTLSGNLNFNTSANQINSTSAVELALNYAGSGARHTSIFDGQGNFIMRAHANGNVGIGTSEPQYKLDVNGSVRTGTIIIDEHVSDAGLKINNNSNTYSRIRFFDSDNNVGTIHAFTGNQFLFNNQKCINIDSMGAVSLGHWNEPNVYINTVNGCVGISNTNPQFKLDVYGASRIYGSLHLNNEGWLNLYNGANTSTISLSHNNASSKLDIYNRTLGNWANVECGFINLDTITMKNNLSEKFIRSNAWGGAIRLRANSGAATDRGLQLGRVDNNLAFTSFMAFNGDSGNVSIASTLDNGYKLDVNGSGHYASELYLDYGLRISNAAGSGEGISLFAESSTNPNYGLMFARTIYKGTHGAVNGDWATYFTMSPDAGRGWIFTNSASSTNGNVASISNTGNFTASGEVTAYSASDIRLKTNIKPITSAIDVINKLNPVQYNWNEKAKELNPLKTDSTEYGLIAQELEKVMPELVHTIYDKYKSIDYVKLVPILIKAVQELKSENDFQQKQIDELKNK